MCRVKPRSRINPQGSQTTKHVTMKTVLSVKAGQGRESAIQACIPSAESGARNLAITATAQTWTCPGSVRTGQRRESAKTIQHIWQSIVQSLAIFAQVQNSRCLINTHMSFFRNWTGHVTVVEKGRHFCFPCTKRVWIRSVGGPGCGGHLFATFNN